MSTWEKTIVTDVEEASQDLVLSFRKTGDGAHDYLVEIQIFSGGLPIPERTSEKLVDCGLTEGQMDGVDNIASLLRQFLLNKALYSVVP
jgi:hypothetical protein